MYFEQDTNDRTVDKGAVANVAAVNENAAQTPVRTIEESNSKEQILESQQQQQRPQLRPLVLEAAKCVCDTSVIEQWANGSRIKAVHTGRLMTFLIG